MALDADPEGEAIATRS
ncbi:hypothetical protein [Vulcanisaeta souniana]|nr:hypothetical protein [Vulcanisaeta souniana]